MLSLTFARKVFDRVSTRVLTLPLFCRDLCLSTFSTQGVPEGSLRTFLARPKLENHEQVAKLADLFLHHRFDFYGSDWAISRERRAWSVPRPARLEAKRLREKLQAGYTPLEWQEDLATGYLWSARTWFQNIRRAVDGGDVRRPWELGRCHHWHLLARAYGQTRDPRFVAEIQNQFYDFVSANPPRFGVQWSSSMDVAIRAANWLMTWDLLKAFEAELPTEFVADLKTSIWQHGQHLRRHLESTASDRANHYLANVAGLLFIAVYLPPSKPTAEWRELAQRELDREIRHQFLADGGSFEGSTCYHALSAEMLIYSFCISQAASHPLPGDWPDMLAKILSFSTHIRKPDGRVPQIGDNDSGRFLKLDPRYEDGGALRERSLDQSHLARAYASLFTVTENKDFESQILRQLTQAKTWSVADVQQTSPLGNVKLLRDFAALFATTPEQHRHRITLGWRPEIETRTLEVRHWPDFGLYVIRNDKFYLSIRCDQRRHASMEGHAHNDLFAIDLQVQGLDLLRDPGSQTYYPEPAMRNRYRSIHNHFPTYLLAPVARERFSQRLFTFPNRLAGECLYFAADGFVGRSSTVPAAQLSVRVHSNYVQVDLIAPYALTDEDRATPGIRFSPAYGRVGESAYLSEFIVASRAPL